MFSAGIRPRDELARQCVLAIGPRGGVVIDDHCRTSDRNVYAIGECASWQDQTFGLVTPGYDMARVAARHIAGEAEAFRHRARGDVRTIRGDENVTEHGVLPRMSGATFVS